MNKIPSGKITASDLKNNIRHLELESKGTSQKNNKSDLDEARFPVDVFPLKLQELISGAETALGLNPCFFSTSILFAAASAIGNTYRLEVKKGYYQRPILYLVLVGNPNTNKSGALRFALDPIKKADQAKYEKYKSEKEEYDFANDLSKRDKEEAGLKGAVPPPIYSRTLVSDITPEALASVHLDNLRGVSVFRDELSGWVKDFNRYRKGGEMEMWLSCWNGETLIIDRKSGEPIRIQNSFIGVAGTIQPGVLGNLGKGDRSSNGFIDRLLFSWPMGQEKVEWTEDEINLPLLESYENAINRLLSLSMDTEGKLNTLSLSKEARESLFHFFNKENKRLCDEAENDTLKGIYGKFDIHTIRFIIVLHLLHWSYKETGISPSTIIKEETVQMAIRVSRYFQKQALKVYEKLHNESPIDQLRKDRQNLYKALPDQFKKKDGEEIALSLGMKKRTFSRFLNDEGCIEKVAHGIYAKKY
jgi:hypothetical protein